MNTEELSPSIVFQQGGRAMTTSLIVAQQFEKEHRHVLDAIRKLIAGSAQNSAYPQQMFQEQFYTNEQNGQRYPFYLMTRDGFTLLAMGFTGERALEFKMKFLQAFNAMEKMLNSDDYILIRSQQILQKRAESLSQQVKELTRANEAQQALIEEQKPKVVFADAIVGSTSSCLISELAKILSQNGYPIGQNRLFAWLRDNHYLGTTGEYYNIPYQRYVEMGLFEIKKNTHSQNGVMITTSTPKVTGKGQQYFINKFLGHHKQEAVDLASINPKLFA